MFLEAIKNYYSRYSNRFPRLSFQESPSFPALKLLAAKEVKFTDKNGKQKEGISVLVKNLNDESYYQFLTTSLSLLEKLSHFEEGTILSIEMKKIKTPTSFKSFYEVNPIKKEELTNEDIESINKFLGKEEEEELTEEEIFDIS